MLSPFQVLPPRILHPISHLTTPASPFPSFPMEADKAVLCYICFKGHQPAHVCSLVA